MSSLSDHEQLSTNTVVNFCHIEQPTISTVRYAQNFDTDCKLIVVEQTPFHPIDYNWPDHPSDTGYITINKKRHEVINCLVLAFNHDTQSISLDKAIPVKKDSPGWTFHVAHIIRDSGNSLIDELTQNSSIALEVNKVKRQHYSVSHSICHLTALAFNAVCTKYWRKSINSIDSLGNPDLDRLSIQSSKIKENGSIDIYRLGKSIRKKGLQVAEIVAYSNDISHTIEERVKQWLLQCPTISLTPLISRLNAKREWSCELDGKMVVIPCGGTHPQILSSSIKIVVKINFSEQQLHLETFLTNINNEKIPPSA